MKYVSSSVGYGVGLRVVLIERELWDPDEQPAEDNEAIEACMQKGDIFSLVAIRGKWTPSGTVFFLGIREKITELRMITASQAITVLSSLGTHDPTVVECLEYACHERLQQER